MELRYITRPLMERFLKQCQSKVAIFLKTYLVLESLQEGDLLLEQ